MFELVSLLRVCQSVTGWDALYLLAEYGESVKNKDDCMARLTKFIGVDQDTLYENCDFGLGVGEHGPYWLM